MNEIKTRIHKYNMKYEDCKYPLVCPQLIRTTNVLVARNLNHSLSCYDLNKMFKEYAFHRIVHGEYESLLYVTNQITYTHLLSSNIKIENEELHVCWCPADSSNRLEVGNILPSTKTAYHTSNSSSYKDTSISFNFQR
ncbi:hypothetical protein RF11_06268 [Thelohanellus kitauei]|uniref:Uncharacterized protein n=1 Tax=Thelohanellus kitauei TaxID=669202 RepID=A0A0C2J2P4_THEKT|nr:hypothetical protein RF11_06268 [Thelohanellus kitauei]